MSDSDVWEFIQPEDLWIYDKLILSKRLGYLCGPAGVPVPHTGEYIVRPCVNYRMMGAGAEIMTIQEGDDVIPNGFFWCEVFDGRHLSFDYHKDKQILAVEGFRNGPRLDRFSRWERVNEQYFLPDILAEVSQKYEYMNVEVIGDMIIEVHLRYNDDFEGHNSKVILPVWADSFKESRCGDRVGFILTSGGR
jgi:hypothetical protein